MTSTSVVDPELDGSRSRPNPGDPSARPNPGYRVAPSVTDAYAPWVSALDDHLESGEYRWIVGADGALVPTPVADADERSARPKRRLWGRRTQ
jgi:hypothetical protein